MEFRINSSCSVCDWCGKDVYFGNAMVTINRNIEQIDISKQFPDGIVTVIQSDVLLSLCAECGNQLNATALGQSLKNF